MTVQACFKKHFIIKLDNKLIENINKYFIAILTKNKDNIDYMSSHYTGVHNIHYTDEDIENFFFMLDIDKVALIKDIKHISGLNNNWKVVTDPTNLTMIWLIHLFIVSPIASKIKEKVITQLGILMQFKMLTSLYFNYFKYNLDIDTANMLYEKLSNRFILKKLGSNYKVLEYRANTIITNETLYKKIKTGKIADIVYVVADIQGAIRSMTKVQYRVLLEILESENTRSTTSPIGRDGEGIDRIMDVDDIHSYFIRTINEKILFKDEFINNDLIDLICEIFTKTNKKAVLATLAEINKRAITDPKHMLPIIESSIEVSIKYLYTTKLYPPYSDRVISVLKYLKGLWSSANAKDSRMKVVKNDIMDIVKDTTGMKTTWVITSTSIIIIIYIFVLVITSHKRK